MGQGRAEDETEGLEHAKSWRCRPESHPCLVRALYVGQASFSGVYLKQATTLACSPSSASAVVGTADGYLYFLDVHNVEAPRVIHTLFLSESPVKILT